VEDVAVTSESKRLVDVVQRVASATNRPFQPLKLQALIQLPRIASLDGVVDGLFAESELSEIAGEVPETTEWAPGVPENSPRDLAFGPVDEQEAFEVMQRFHYLRSPRLGGVYYGLRSRVGRVAAFCACSKSDEPVVEGLLASAGHDAPHTSIVSRVFAFEGAPRNSLSFMFARVLLAERARGMTVLATYVNPNLGFTGSSYLASGWRLLGEQRGTRYRYLDKRYITDRVLAAQFGKGSDEVYHRLLGGRFAVSQMPLKPLLVFAIDAKPTPAPA
jgi:hypothetical protein